MRLKREKPGESLLKIPLPVLILTAVFLFPLSCFAGTAFTIQNVPRLLPQKGVLPRSHPDKPLNPLFSIGMLAGCRVDELDWNIAGNLSGKDPDVLSELKWSHLESQELVAEFRTRNRAWPNVEASFRYGRITNGRCRDSDYLADNRQEEFSRILCDADKGYVLDLSAGIGYPFRSQDGRWRCEPAIGYARHRQSLALREGVQRFPALPSAAPGKILYGLNSSYDATWQGCWIGVLLGCERERPRPFFFRIGLKYHILDYYAEADWNLRSKLMHPRSFEHEAKGYGLGLAVAVGYEISEGFSIHLDADRRRFRAEDGIDRLFRADGRETETRLNRVEWESYAVHLGFTLLF